MYLRMEVVGPSRLGQKTDVSLWVAWSWRPGRKGPSGHSLTHTGIPQVNEVVFSPNESHCATCGEDGSVRVWSLASMELVIQFQVLNQVSGEFWEADLVYAQSRAQVICYAPVG